MQGDVEGVNVRLFLMQQLLGAAVDSGFAFEKA